MPSLKFRAPFISKSKDFVRFFDDRFFTMNYSEYSDKPGAFSLSIPFGRFTQKTSNRDFELIESIMQFYVEITKELVHTLKPVYAWISEIDEYIPKIRRETQEGNLINVLFWSNFFSNKEFSPGFIHFIEQSTVGFSIISDHGIWYQLSEKFLSTDRKSMQHIVEEAYQYFSTKGIGHIIWL